MAIRTLIVDDEAWARQRLRSLLSQEPDVTILGECGDGAAAIEAIRTQAPDVVFLDIQMPEVDGFAVLQSTAERHPMVVFVTAHEQHALPAFAAGALDYLLKPFKPARFRQALERVRERLRERPSGRPPGYLRRILVRDGDRVRVVKTELVDWIESARNHIVLHIGGDAYVVRESLNTLVEGLDPEQFLRISRFAIVQLDRIRELKSTVKGSYVVVMTDGLELPLTLALREIQEWLEFS